MIRSCMLSRAPLEPGDTVVAVVVRQMPWLPTNAGYLESPTDLWAPVSLPIYGRMGPRGLGEVEDSWVKDALCAWGAAVTSEASSKWSVGPMSPETWSGPQAWVEMERRVRQGTLMCTLQDGSRTLQEHTKPLSIAYIHEEAYDDVSATLVDVSVERKLLLDAKATLESFKVGEEGNPEIHKVAHSARQIQDQMIRIRFEMEDNNTPFFGEGVMSFYRAYLMNEGVVTDEALSDLLQFDAFQNHLRLSGIPWVPNVLIPE